LTGFPDIAIVAGGIVGCSAAASGRLVAEALLGRVELPATLAAARFEG